MTSSGTITSSFWLPRHQATAWVGTPFSFVSRLRSPGLLGAGSGLLVLVPPSHVEHGLHAGQSSGPLAMSLVHKHGWAPCKGPPGLQMESLTMCVCGASHLGSRGSLATAASWLLRTGLGFPSAPPRGWVSCCHYTVRGFDHPHKLPPQENPFGEMLCFPGLHPACGFSLSSWCQEPP